MRRGGKPPRRMCHGEGDEPPRLHVLAAHHADKVGSPKAWLSAASCIHATRQAGYGMQVMRPQIVSCFRPTHGPGDRQGMR